MSIKNASQSSCGRWLAVVLSITALAAGQVGADCYMDFERFETGIPITDQYQQCGVVFAGAPGDPPPETYDYGTGDVDTILHSYDWYAPIVVSFVDPWNGVQPRPVAYVEFDSATGDQDRVHVQVFDAAGQLLDTYDSPLDGGPETVAFTFPSAVVATMVIDDIDDTAFTVDSLLALDTAPVFLDRFVSEWNLRWSDVVTQTATAVHP